MQTKIDDVEEVIDVLAEEISDEYDDDADEYKLSVTIVETMFILPATTLMIWLKVISTVHIAVKLYSWT